MQEEQQASQLENEAEKAEESEEISASKSDSCAESNELDSVLDISGKSLELSLFEGGDGSDRSGGFADSIDGLYVYRNLLNLMPRCLGSFGGRLKKLKYFGNEINLFPPEFEDLVGLESLQIKVSPIALNGLKSHKLKTLKELELSKVPPRPSALPILSEIVGLKCLTKLSVCHFSIRYLPPEISYLTNLEHLDLSFNKMRSLPKEIGSLSALISLNVANNKLMELPADMSFLQRLENLDLSTNRLTSLANFEIRLMHNLHNLNLQNNKLLGYCEIPGWICCHLEGNDKDLLNDDFVEMDVLEATTVELGSISNHVSSSSSSSLLTGSSMSSRCFSTRWIGKRWKRRQYLQQRARQERISNSRKWKVKDHADILTIKATEKYSGCQEVDLVYESLPECRSSITHADNGLVHPLCGEAESGDFDNSREMVGIWSKRGLDLGNYDAVDHGPKCKVTTSSVEYDGCSACLSSAGADEEAGSSTESEACPKSKRLSDMDLQNPKPRKSRRSFNDPLHISRKYSEMSFCSIDDHLPEGFYDAGRDRPFMSLNYYEQNVDLYAREVILIDRNRDEELDAITLSAQSVVYKWKLLIGSRQGIDDVADDNLRIASLLALFVSDRFGGSDKSSLIQRIRKDVSGSNYLKPFVCTCSTGNSQVIREYATQNIETIGDAAFHDICEKSFRNIKAACNSVVIPIGTLQFGLCRHRAILMKYLCDRMEPPVPCELVRGYLDFSPHAWNVVLIKRGESWVRMVVDACRPHDIHEEANPEYFCRYIPMNRIITPSALESNTAFALDFSSMMTGEEVEKGAFSSLILCRIGSVEAAAKVRKLEISGASCDETRQFEYNCLAEVRILGAVRGHSCIIELYGHHIFSEWVPASEKKPEHRVLRSAILMEYVKGGSLKKYIDKLSKAGEKHVPVALALSIARDVAGALKELHSKHIIHRDIKSDNILLDLDKKRADGSPIVKLCDFDRAVPLRSSVHACCIGHVGIHPPDTCVGTPRWMAPELLHAMNKHNRYGLEVDIWSYGCMIMELLTLQVPYVGLLDSDIHDLLQNGKRPPLTDDLEVMRSLKETAVSKSGVKPEETNDETNALSFLVDLFVCCTQGNPTDRPTAENLYELLLAKTSSFNNQS
ncbi:hypothetical protein Dimus_028870 [Dionaea muscipula]